MSFEKASHKEEQLDQERKINTVLESRFKSRLEPDDFSDIYDVEEIGDRKSVV